MTKVIFKDGSVVEYPEGARVSDSPDGLLKHVLDVGGETIASLPAGEVQSTETV